MSCLNYWGMAVRLIAIELRSIGRKPHTSKSPPGVSKRSVPAKGCSIRTTEQLIGVHRELDKKKPRTSRVLGFKISKVKHPHLFEGGLLPPKSTRAYYGSFIGGQAGCEPIKRFLIDCHHLNWPEPGTGIRTFSSPST